MLVDYHVHTDTSIDARATLKEYCEKAKQLGINEFCVTNHHELFSVDNETYEYALNEENIVSLKREIEIMKKKYNLQIRFGVELGYYEGREKELFDFIKKNEFDYVLGSVHLLDGVMITSKQVLDADKSELIKRYKRYFQLLKQAIELRFFDCVAHFELPRKEMPQLEFNEYKDHAAECIVAMKKNNVGFELNTGGWRRVQREAYPRKEILSMLYEAGIRNVTLGSDCHGSEELGYGINQGLKLLVGFGFKELCTFDKRKPCFKKIVL